MTTRLSTEQEQANIKALKLIRDEQAPSEDRLKAFQDLNLLVLATLSNNPELPDTDFDDNDGELHYAEQEQENVPVLILIPTNKLAEEQFTLTNDRFIFKIAGLSELTTYTHSFQDENQQVAFIVADEDKVGFQFNQDMVNQAYDVFDKLTVTNIIDDKNYAPVINAIFDNLPENKDTLESISVYVDYRESQERPVSSHIVFGRRSSHLKNDILPLMRTVQTAIKGLSVQYQPTDEVLHVGFGDEYMEDVEVNQQHIYTNSALAKILSPSITDEETKVNYQKAEVFFDDNSTQRDLYNALKEMVFLVTTTKTDNQNVSNPNFDENDGHFHFVDNLKDKKGELHLYLSDKAFNKYAEHQTIKFSRDKITLDDLIAIAHKAYTSEEVDDYTYIFHNDVDGTIDINSNVFEDMGIKFNADFPLVNLVTDDDYKHVIPEIAKLGKKHSTINKAFVLFQQSKDKKENFSSVIVVDSDDFNGKDTDTFILETIKVLLEEVKNQPADKQFSFPQVVSNIKYLQDINIDKTPAYQKRKKLFGLF